MLLLFTLSLMSFAPDQAEAKKRMVIRKRVILKRHRRYRRALFKSSYEYFLSPRVRVEDQPLIIDGLKEKGVNFVEFKTTNNSLILKFKSSEVSALDIMKTLKDLGYTVSSIN